MNLNLIPVSLVLFSILPYSFSQDANAFTQQYGSLISQGLGAVEDAAKKNGGDGSSNIQNLIQSAKTVQAKCVTKLMPCRENFKDSTNEVVAQSCCQPLRVVISEDMDCLCGVVKGQSLLQTMNLTLDNVFNVAKTCGAEPDVTACDDFAPAPAPVAEELETLTQTVASSPQSSLTKSIESTVPSASAPAPSTTHAADESAGHMEKSSIIVLVSAFMLLAI